MEIHIPLRRDHTPAGQQGVIIFARQRNISEHIGHIGHATDIPRAQVLVKHADLVEHRGHIGHATDIPRAQVLVEYEGLVEHRGHIGHATDIPRAQVLVEPIRAVEHSARIGDATDIPDAKRLIERVGVLEHIRHVGHVADIPIANRRIEVDGALKHRPHTGHRRQVGTPGVGRDGEVGDACETVLHTAPDDVAPLLNGADCEAVATAAEVNLRESADDGDRIGAGCGVGMNGIAALIDVDGAVSPVHRIIVGIGGTEGAVGRDDDDLVGLDDPSSHKRGRSPADNSWRALRLQSTSPSALPVALWRERRSIGCRQRGKAHLSRNSVSPSSIILQPISRES